MLLSFLLPQLQKLHAYDPIPLHRYRIAAGVSSARWLGPESSMPSCDGGKLAFCWQCPKLPHGTKIFFSETALHLPDREISYDELFYRKSDAIVVRARTVELLDRGYTDVTVRLSPVLLEIEAGTDVGVLAGCCERSIPGQRRSPHRIRVSQATSTT